MLTQHPQWVDPASFPSISSKTKISLQDSYQVKGPIPFPKDIDPLDGLQALLNDLLVKPLNNLEVNSIKKLSKKISVVKENVNIEDFHNLFSHNIVYNAKNLSPLDSSGVFEVTFPYIGPDSENNVFQCLIKSMDSIFAPPHAMTIRAMALVPKSCIDSFDLNLQSDLKDLCSQIKIDSTLINNVEVAFSHEHPDHCKITIEKRIPF